MSCAALIPQPCHHCLEATCKCAARGLPLLWGKDVSAQSGGGAGEFTLRMGRPDMADCPVLTIETVTRALSALEAEGAILRRVRARSNSSTGASCARRRDWFNTAAGDQPHTELSTMPVAPRAGHSHAMKSTGSVYSWRECHGAHSTCYAG
ncbi:helix-turn-helix domain-containing protein [Paraburkholderia sp. J8-2]|uniref:helix-turn-helix domain-containing protein n=1 Tax=Paraburkholderia sp. J8-2 TaxID=2805440 RepID=UPI0039F1248C